MPMTFQSDAGAIRSVAVISPVRLSTLPHVHQCIQSVTVQTYPATHYLVFEGVAPPPDLPSNAQILSLPREHPDHGHTARSLGAMSALNKGFQAFAFLDASHRFAPDHIDHAMTLIEDHRARIAATSRTLILDDGTPLEDDDEEVAARTYVDLNTLLMTSEVAFLLPLWAMINPELKPASERVIFKFIRDLGIRMAMSAHRTVTVRSNAPRHYRLAGRQPPQGATEPELNAILDAFDPEIAWRRMRLRLSRADLQSLRTPS